MRPLIRVIALTLAMAMALDAAEPAAAPMPTAIAEARAAATKRLLDELAVDDPRRRAWAARELGALGLGEARPALVALAEALAGDDGGHAPLVREQALDALIRLPGTTPPPLVAELVRNGRARTATLLLAVREPEAHREALVALVDARAGDADWLAACQALVPLREPRLAAHLADGLALRLEVQVHDPGHGGGRRRVLGVATDGAIEVAPGWPPRPDHRLTLKAEPGAIVVVDGWRPVYWLRREYATSRGVGSWSSSLDRDEARIELLRRLAQPWTTTSLEATTRATIVWKDLDDCRRQLDARRAAVLQARHDLLAPLAAQGLLPGDWETRFPERLKLEVTDHRRVREPALPEAASATAAAGE